MHKTARWLGSLRASAVGRELFAHSLRCLSTLTLLFTTHCGRVGVDLLPGCEPVGTSDATCDGVDDDCDGTPDEDFATQATSCGAGSCSAAGELVCRSGVQVDTCMPRTPAALDVICGGDDDCDGTIDEDVTPRSSTCGAGVCTASGTATCVSGAELDSCRPGAPTLAMDTTCNGVDEDCSGSNDEDFPAQASSCGVGACAAVGSIRCANAALVDNCTPGTPSASDATCDGVDDDCDGTRDENFVVSASTCGVGGCGSTGIITCAGCVISDSCRAGTPASADTTCNGVDENCNGTPDEGYVAVVSSCGLGVCRASGMVVCSGGTASDTCRAGIPVSVSDGPPANGLDDDCDGSIDEDSCVAAPVTYPPGSYPNIALPAGCTRATVRLWGGGGGAGGQSSVGTTGEPGTGGAGGFAQQAVTGGPITLYVGNGGAGCGAGGVNPGSTSYAGGNGADQGGNGTAGADGVVAGGGAGATTGTGNGARGYYGGGGGGSGTLAPWPPYPGLGGGGGAASVLLVAGTRTAYAGGGGGGGGANGSSVASVGGAGGEGCAGPGGGANAGGGGGGGACAGATFARGTSGTPANASAIPAGYAAGGGGACGNGGAGYAIVSFQF